MAEYHISEIKPGDERALRQLDALLNKEGIQRDRLLDYTAGLYDEDYLLAAAGSCFGNTLRCMAVDSERRGEGLLGQLISHLTEYQCARGISHLFLYTKAGTAPYFKDLGFYEIARTGKEAVFMENRRDGFSRYLKKLALESSALEKSLPPSRLPAGAAVINANPFTLGHQYLLEQACASCRLLHVFVVSEDVSLVPFSVRLALIRQGCSHLTNMVIHETESYLISNATFPSYFLRDEEAAVRAHAGLDTQLFRQIAAALSISVRFVGEEPLSRVTNIYNEVMAENMGAGKDGLRLSILPRLKKEGIPVSASHVRRLIHEGRVSEIRGLVPETTYRYFSSPEAAPVICAIREAESGQVIHC